MKYILEIVIHCIATILFVSGPIIAFGNPTLGIGLFFTSFFIFGILGEFQENKKETQLKKIILGLRIPILMIILFTVLAIAAYYQAVAYEKFGVLGYYAIGPIGIWVLCVIFLRLKEFFKNR